MLINEYNQHEYMGLQHLYKDSNIYIPDGRMNISIATNCMIDHLGL